MAHSPWFELIARLRHARIAKGPHGIHSPFIFRLITEVLPSQKSFAFFDTIEKYRRRLRNDSRTIDVEDHGAGSRVDRGSHRSVSRLARYALQPKRSAQAIARLVADMDMKVGLELGTSLGITTSYLALAQPTAHWTSIEGAPQIADLARQTIADLQAQTEVITGTFDDVLPGWLAQGEKLDVVLIDGNHTYAATKRYVDWILPHMAGDGVILIDDIHWSADMESAWSEIIQRSEVTLSADFFHWGALWLRKGVEKQHFILKHP